jgi:hypothetical protein
LGLAVDEATCCKGVFGYLAIHTVDGDDAWRSHFSPEVQASVPEFITNFCRFACDCSHGRHYIAVVIYDMGFLILAIWLTTSASAS